MNKTAEEIAADLAKPGDVEIVVICSDSVDDMDMRQRESFAERFKAMTGRSVLLLRSDATVRVLRLSTGTVDESQPLALVALTEEQVRRIEEALRSNPVGRALTDKQLKVTPLDTGRGWEPNE